MEIALGFVVVLVCFITWMYNRLVRARNYALDAWSGIGVQLTKRHDLIPLLANVVKSYAKHETDLLVRTTELRAPNISDDTQKTEQREQSFGKQLNQIVVLAEDYPEIKADQNFQRLQDNLVAVEGDIESARRYYNGAVRDLNVLVESFPSNLIARQFSFESRKFFELELPAMRATPLIKLS
ncbi:LemA family protein [Arenicella xantha]|uniref:LemA protein n=1 Tax=Arenicella xantha TaxID=644221 RepID=A0A395JLF7_9GAMM|nr:LemA family protein [Arenicella xantha]RBP51255.1 LemA protein [Arenicella xantha]